MKKPIPDPLVLYNQLVSLRDRVNQIEPEAADRRGCPGSGISAFILPFNFLLENAKELLTDDVTALVAVADIQPVEQIEERLRATYHKKAKYQILIGIDRLLATLEPRLSKVVNVPSMKVVREGVFFAGQYFDALRLTTEILASAQRSMVIIDGYINIDVLNLFTTKRPGVRVQILTKAKTLPEAVVTMAEAFNKQYGQNGTISIRTSEAFHDRFVIIDDTDFYHFGASLKDLGGRGFMFSRIEELNIIDMLRKQFADEWERGPVKV